MPDGTPDPFAAPASSSEVPAREYHPPELTRYGDLATITGKTVGAADGATFLGLDIGSVPVAGG